MSRDRFTLPDDPPSSRLLPESERRERARALEWMHDAAAPHRKKRVDAPPDPMWMQRAEHAFGKGIFDPDD
jgi:hypothetical protein